MSDKEYLCPFKRLYERNMLVSARHRDESKLLIAYWYGADAHVWGIEPDTRSWWRRWMDDFRYPVARSRHSARVVVQSGMIVAVGRYIPRLSRDLYEG